MKYIPNTQKYAPGEPYEFLGSIIDGFPVVPRYRCFRGRCRGAAVMTADRNTHNHYHNCIERV